MSLQTIKYEELDEGRIIRICLNRPKTLNAMNMPFFNEIRDTFKKINEHEKARAVILQGEGKIFTSGLDLKEMGSLFSSGDTQDSARTSIAVYNTIRAIQQPFINIYECRVPVIVGVHNLCIGGGIDLICATDIRYCTKDAQFNIKQIDIGMAADIGTLQLFPRRVGNDSAFREMAYTAKNINSQEAKSIGLVSKIFEDNTQLEAGLLETARIIAAKSPIGIYAIKLTIQRNQRRQVLEGLQNIARLNSVMLQTKDTIQSITSFMQKKKPQYSKL